MVRWKTLHKRNYRATRVKPEWTRIEFPIEEGAEMTWIQAPTFDGRGIHTNNAPNLFTVADKISIRPPTVPAYPALYSIDLPNGISKVVNVWMGNQKVWSEK